MWARAAWLFVLRTHDEIIFYGIYIALALLRHHRARAWATRMWKRGLARPARREVVAGVARYKRNQEIFFACVGLAFNALGFLYRWPPILLAAAALLTLVRQSSAILRAHRFVTAPHQPGTTVMRFGPMVFLERDGKLNSWYTLQVDPHEAAPRRLPPPAD